MESTKQYQAQWPDEVDGATPGEYVQKIADLSHEMELENRLMYFKTVDEDGNKHSHEGPEEEGLKHFQEDAVVDNLRVEYADSDRSIVLEYDSGSLGDPYRLKVEGDDEFRASVESVVDRELSPSTGQQVKEKVSKFTDKVGDYLDDRGED